MEHPVREDHRLRVNQWFRVNQRFRVIVEDQRLRVNQRFRVNQWLRVNHLHGLRPGRDKLPVHAPTAPSCTISPLPTGPLSSAAANIHPGKLPATAHT